MPRHGAVLLGMPDTELLGILKIMFEVVEGKQADRKFGSHTVKPSSTPSYKAISGKEIQSDNADVFIHNEFSDIFSGIAHVEGMFRLQVKKGSQPYQAPPRKVVYALQEPLREEVKELQKQQTTVLLGVDEMSKWHNSFVLVLKANDKVLLSLGPASLN